MSIRWGRDSIIAGLIAASAALGHTAHAAAPYQGIYVIVDPYNSSQLNMLKKASQTACTQSGAATASPFCGAANGVLLRMPWCDFQPYHVNNAQGRPNASCHYMTVYTNGVSGAAQQVPATDTASPCATTYDTCSGSAQSVLGSALSMIAQVNTYRAQAGMPALKLSVGLAAGIWTAQSVLDSNGFADVPFDAGSGVVPASVRCYRMPLAWKPNYVAAYDAAVDQLVSYIGSQKLNGSAITLLKASGINADSLEVNMPGHAQAEQAPGDPGPAGPGGALKCSSTVSGAQVWLSAYQAAPVGGHNFSQAVESAFGSIVGHSRATLLNAGLPTAELSVATNGGQAFANVNCGATGATSCTINAASGNWNIYYLHLYVTDLFNGGLAQSAAAAAYQAARADTYALSPSQLAVNWTGLSPAPIDSSEQIVCELNNTMSSRQASISLNSRPTTLMGVGTLIGWQTDVNQGGTCSSGAYGKMLTNAIGNGGEYLEVEPDAAFTDLGSCSPQLTKALSSILAAPAFGNCAY